MPRPIVAIIGQPNVGKSSLFNRLAGKRISIEDDTSGVTRDRLSYSITIEERQVELIDTGGIGIVDRADLANDVEKQIDRAIEIADLIIFLLDCREGLTPLDKTIAERLRKIDKPLLLAANKADTDKIALESHAFAQLGLGETLAVSAHQGRGIEELLLQVSHLLPEQGDESEYDEDCPKFAFVGKRNAGKSSLINKLAGEKRVIVSDKPGTTRDSVDVLFKKGSKSFVAIDTAGIRRRGKMDDAIEFFGQVRSERAIRRADVAVMLIDASEPVSKVDKRIAQLIAEEYKPCLLAINKWDLALEKKPEITPEAYHQYLLKELPALHYAPLAVTSALTGENIWGLIEVATDIFKQSFTMINTGQVNKALQNAYQKHRPASIKGKRCKIYYGTQTDTAPPTFVIFCNNPKAVSKNYIRYLSGQLGKDFGLTEVPLRLEFRSSHQQKA